MYCSIIDKAIIQNAAGAARLEISILNSFMDAVKSPRVFLRRPEVLMVWGVSGSSFHICHHHMCRNGFWHSFLRSSWPVLTWTIDWLCAITDQVYSFTYVAANVITTTAEVKRRSPDMARLFGTTVSGVMYGPARSGVHSFSMDLPTTCCFSSLLMHRVPIWSLGLQKTGPLHGCLVQQLHSK